MVVSWDKHTRSFLFLFAATVLISLSISITIAAADSPMAYKGKPFNLVRSNLKTAAGTSDTADTFQIGDQTRPSQDAVDVSSYQGDMTQNDYNILAKNGVKSVIVKLTEGTDYTNPYATTQMKYAANAGLNVNIYHYATFGSSGQATSEANYLLDVLKNNGINTNVKIFADMESESTQSVNIESYLNTFWETLKNGDYSNHGVYTFSSYPYRSAVINTVGESNTWIAQFPYHPSADNLLNSNYGAWQFSQTAQIPGGTYAGGLDVSHDYQGIFSNGAGTEIFSA